MNDISEAILQAQQIVSENLISSLKFDKTIKGTIYAVIDVDSGEYKVRYEGNIFAAYADDTSKSYSVDDQVYVKVPEGDFSSRKIITSLVTAKSLSSATITAKSNSISMVSPTFDALYGGAYDANASYGVVAGADPDSNLGHKYIYLQGDTFAATEYDGLFQQYANSYEYIRIQASFQTQFHATHTKGNYGIEVAFYAKAQGDDKTSVVTYRLDIENFNGSPYSFSNYATQSVVMKAQKNYLLGLKYVKLFQKDFDYDSKITSYDVDFQPVRSDITNTPNIFVKDINIAYVEVKDLTSENYYLTISAPKGATFNATVTDLSLVGCLIYKGEDIIDKSKCEFQWYERDLSKVIGSDGYSKTAGFGWAPIEGATTKTLNLTIDDIEYTQQYKLIVEYGKEATLSAEIEVTNKQHNYSFYLSQVTNIEEDSIYLQLVNNLEDQTLYGDWYLSKPDSSYSQLQLGKTQIVISEYLQYSTVTFYCRVYNESGVYLGTLEHTIVNSENSDDVVITYEGEDTFRYDSNGDVTIEDSEKERTLQAKVAWKEGVGASYTIAWYMKDSDNVEHELTTDPYEPDNSLIDSIWVDTYKILHYNIKQKFKVTQNNNSVILRITTITEEKYSFEKEILFVKDGDQGTNGTTYICAVRPCADSGDKKSGLQVLRYRNGSWDAGIKLRCYVYKDGEFINGDSNYSITYRWEGNQVTVDGESLTSDSGDQVEVRGVPTISADISSLNKDFYVKVQVIIKENTKEDTDDDTNSKSVSIYASYPLDVIVGNDSIITSDIDITDIPSYIKYNSSGESPSYYSNAINFYYKEVAYNENIKSLNSDILTIKTPTTLDSSYYLKPTSSFIFESIEDNKTSNIGVLQMAIPSTSSVLIHPVFMYLDTYGNEAINGWDGTSIETEDGHIFAPQVGAGEKDEANRFTGVVMGKDSGQDNNIGLFGYQVGANTFGFLQDGTAYIGPKSDGQIRFDGTDGGSTIMSNNYETSNGKAGMCITLKKGIIDSPTFSFDGEKQQFTFELNSDSNAEYSSYFQITTPKVDANGNPTTTSTNLFYVGFNGTKSSYYLQSADYDVSGHTGTRIDLANGKITSYDFSINSYNGSTRVLRIDSGEQKFQFDIGGSTGSFVITKSSKNSDGSINSYRNIIAVYGSSGNDSYIQSVNNSNLYINLTEGTLKAEAGYIGGWELSDEGLSSGSTELKSDGTINCTVGNIGGWVLSATGLHDASNTTYITPGKIYGATIQGSYIYSDLYHVTVKVDTDDGVETRSVGTMGYIVGNNGSTSTIAQKVGIGINSPSIIKLFASDGISINTGSSTIWLESSVDAGKGLTISSGQELTINGSLKMGASSSKAGAFEVYASSVMFSSDTAVSVSGLESTGTISATDTANLNGGVRIGANGPTIETSGVVSGTFLSGNIYAKFAQ